MFIGREEELESFNGLWAKRQASLVAVRGRRRIGKSTFVEEFARRSGATFVNIDGLPPRSGMTNADQLENFAVKLAAQTSAVRLSPPGWFEAFRMLDGAIDDRRRTVVLLDEISWMGKFTPDFPGYLKSAWDTALKKHPKLVLVVCGSVSAWIQKNILNNTGFAGRFSRDLVLGELPLRLCAKFWGAKAARLASRDLVDVLSVTGGVPRYLEEVDPSLSAAENVRALFFRSDGTLFRDFSLIFNDVFGENAGVKREILRALAAGPRTCSELAEDLGVGRGGSISENLSVLEQSGFVARDAGLNPKTGRPSRQDRFRVRDNYTRFYLRYVEPHEEAIRKGQFNFMSLESLPGWDSVLGLQFENLVLNDAMALVPFLRLGGVPILSAAPFRLPGTKKEPGCQIDLLLQTRRSAVVVEVKRRREIGEEIEAEVARKVARLPVAPGVSVHTALVYDGHLSPVVHANGYFDAIVSSRDLLGLDGYTLEDC
ncbi:MAG: ATP-binding protein [Kiritimatiellae bacterium]|nr:ATP-binding protein [Kiritimatiellia bacterium]